MHNIFISSYILIYSTLILQWEPYALTRTAAAPLIAAILVNGPVFAANFHRGNISVGLELE